VLVDQLLGRRDGNFAGSGKFVVFQRGFAQLMALFFS
jgi:hypothetical protein